MAELPFDTPMEIEGEVQFIQGAEAIYTGLHWPDAARKLKSRFNHAPRLTVKYAAQGGDGCSERP